MSKNKIFGGDTGVDADENYISIKDVNKEIAKDYKYEHDQINEKSRTMEDILIDLITVHYNHDKLMSVNDFDSYCILAEETYNQENGEGEIDE
jgi:hypothetical protein